MDWAIVQYAHSFIGRFPFIDGIAVFFASYFPYIFTLVFCALLFMSSAFTERIPLLRKKQRLQFILKTILALIIAWGIILPLIRYGYGRMRPFAEFNWDSLIAHEASASFPSGHATLMFTLAASMWQLKKRWGYWFFAGATLTGIARVYSLIHYPTDIIFGALFSILVVFFVNRIIRH